MRQAFDVGCRRSSQSRILDAAGPGDASERLPHRSGPWALRSGGHADARATRLLKPSREVVGLGAVILVFVAISALFALGRPYFAGTDESSHLGYAHVVADLGLPTIDGEPDVHDSATIWEIERASVHDDRYRAVWVANHPPLFYATLAPAIW